MVIGPHWSSVGMSEAKAKENLEAGEDVQEEKPGKKKGKVGTPAGAYCLPVNFAWFAAATSPFGLGLPCSIGRRSHGTTTA